MTDPFEDFRPRLVAIAYGVLGSIMDAEDVVQDAWIKWSALNQDEVRQPQAFLTTMVTRLAIDQLRTARRTREQYLGPWLPEPIVTQPGSDPADIVAEAEELSLGFLHALEKLNPIERAVVVLRDAFDFDYSEIAPIVDKTPENCRQIASRARGHVARPARERSLDMDSDRQTLSKALAAIVAGDVDNLIHMLTAEIVSWSDGGGKRRAARHPIVGPERVARFFTGIAKQGEELNPTFEMVSANGWPAIRIVVDGATYAVLAFEMVGETIQTVMNQLNPDKLV